jgi:hypothetical protein
MPFERTATIVGAGVTLVAWLAGSSTSTPRSVVEPASAKSAGATAVDARGAELAREVAHLTDRLQAVAAPRQPGRNLFSFVASKPRAMAHTEPARAALTEATPARPTPPPLKLSGIAEDARSGSIVRTAIINARGQLFLAKEGEAVTDRYRIARISADVVELNDLADGTILRLALK